MRSIMMSESLTTMPVRATTPKKLRNERGMPRMTCPMTAPMKPNGMADMTISG